MDDQNQKPTEASDLTNILPISGGALGDLVEEILSNDTPFRFKATGDSMAPFIRHDDVVTISPVSDCKPAIGRIAAVINPKNRHLVVHRIISKKDGSVLTKGDNSHEKTDGWINEAQVLGCVTAIERNHRAVRFGLGFERLILAFLSKHRLLRRITRRLDD
mgnify:CR=1 FL=1